MKEQTIIFRSSPVLSEMIEKIKGKRGMKKNSEVIRTAIFELYSQYYKDYGKDSIATKPKKTQEEKEMDRQHELCMLLSGTVEEREGKKYCIYKTYEKVNPKTVNINNQEIPFSLLTTEIIKKQYYPNKEDVEKTLEDIKNI